MRGKNQGNIIKYMLNILCFYVECYVLHFNMCYMTSCLFYILNNMCVIYFVSCIQIDPTFYIKNKIKLHWRFVSLTFLVFLDFSVQQNRTEFSCSIDIILVIPPLNF